MIVKKVTTGCTHCGLPVPPGLVRPDQAEQFCCHGCSAAYQLIHASGLDAFYRMVDSTADQQTLRRRSDLEDGFAEFDEPTFMEKFTRGLPGGLIEANLSLDGIHCAACVWLVEKLPVVAPGVKEAQVNWSRGTVRICWQPEQVRLSQVAAVLHRLGYRPYPTRTSEKGRRREQENRRHLVRIGIAAAAAGNNMLIAAALYLGMFSYMSGGIEWMLRTASCVVGLASLLGPGRVFIRGAWSAIQTRTPHMDLPIALGLTVGSLAGLINTIRGEGEIYFDSLTVLIFLLLVGRWIQFRQQNRAADAIELLYRLTPLRARKIVAGNIREVAVEEIEIGDVVEVRPGDTVPVDAVVVAGRSAVDEAILSGESKPSNKQPGDAVAAGTRNLSSVLNAEAVAVGQDTRISRIVGLVEQAAHAKPEIVQWANRIGGFFVITVIGLAVVTLVVWLLIDASVAVDRAVALLIVACPCALALATPLAISVALGRLAKRRIMVKSGDVIQSLYEPGVIWLDKTGTLTEGRMRVVKWCGDRSWIPLVAQVESKVVHPIADAFIEFNESQPDASRRTPGLPNNVPPPTNANDKANSDGDTIFAELVPGGVTGRVVGHELFIGNRKLLSARGIAIDESWQQRESEILADQLSPCWVAVDDQLVALAGVGDRLRSDAKSLVDGLHKRGWSVGVLSGDHPEIVHAVADRLGIESVRAGVTPEEKLRIIQDSATDRQTIVMVGDGVNDSAALAAATVGIAVHTGAEASLAAAPVYLGRAGLESIEELMQASRSTCHTIRLNFAASLGYNLVGVTLAMAGWINPLVAAVLMPISSLTVIALSLRAGQVKTND